jgi:hypothetical protein
VPVDFARRFACTELLRVVFCALKVCLSGNRLPSIGANLSEIILILPQYDCALVNVAVSIVGC